MIASLDDLSQTSKRTFIQIMSVDGNMFDLPATDDINVSMFMASAKARGCVGNENWYIVYDAILWVAKIQYNAAGAASVEGMVKQ